MSWRWRNGKEQDRLQSRANAVMVKWEAFRTVGKISGTWLLAFTLKFSLFMNTYIALTLCAPGDRRLSSFYSWGN